MQYRLQEAVCPCGSHQLQQGHQVQDQAGRWTTLAERRADPSIQAAPTQQLIWVSDSTHFVCCACQRPIDPYVAMALIHKALGGKAIFELPWKEEIGVGVINPRGLTRLRLDS